MPERSIGVLGAAGRMGRALVRAVADSDGAMLGAAADRPGTGPAHSGAIGGDAGLLAGIGALACRVGDDPDAVFAAVDVVIDFTAPAAVDRHAALAARHATALVVGTTGLADGHVAALRRAAATVPVVYGSNMSLGVNLLLALTRRVAGALGTDFDIEILELHHRHKVDAPSGTALSLGEAAAAGRGVALDAVATRVRDGHTGARPVGDIGFATLRGGDVVGDHTVMFAGPGERIELSHKASDRGIYARGAVRAALWTAGQPPGFYGMADVLGVG